MLVHRPESTLENKEEYNKIVKEIMPVIEELVRKTKPLLENKVSVERNKSRIYGTKFHPEKLASPDLKFFSSKATPEEEPSLAVVLRIDESASMNAFSRLDFARKAAIAVYEFCLRCNIPISIYGDTADSSRMEQMSLYSYIDWDGPELDDKYTLMQIRGRSNNRDGMVLRILSDKLMETSQKTKLLITISDGQPKAMPDYTGAIASSDMKNVISEFSRKGVTFLSAAIGQDKETIENIYGQERFMDITELNSLSYQLVKFILRYL